LSSGFIFFVLLTVSEEVIVYAAGAL